MSGERCSRRPRSMFRLVRMRRSHARKFVPGVYERQLRNARAYVSCTRSSASSRVETSRRATRYTWSDRSSTSSSKRTRSRSCSAMRRASVSGLIAPDSNSATNGDRRLFRGLEACPLERAHDLVAREALVVPGEGDLTHEVGVRALETREGLKRSAQPLHAVFAANARHLDGLSANCHRLDHTFLRRASRRAHAVLARVRRRVAPRPAQGSRGSRGAHCPRGVRRSG